MIIEEGTLYIKSACPHCDEPILIEIDPTAMSIEMYVRGSKTGRQTLVVHNEPASKPTSKVLERAPTAKPKGCTECGSPSRHKATCSKAKPIGTSKVDKPTHTATPRSTGRTILDGPVRLNEDQYDEIRQQSDDGLTAANISYSYPEVELAEIKRAIDSDSFEDYIGGIR